MVDATRHLPVVAARIAVTVLPRGARSV